MVGRHMGWRAAKTVAAGWLATTDLSRAAVKCRRRAGLLPPWHPRLRTGFGIRQLRITGERRSRGRRS